MKSVMLRCSLHLFYLSIFLPFSLSAQVYDDYFGTGHTIGVSISTSSDQNTNIGDHTLNGTGYFPDMEGASRFLAQAGFGGSYEEIEYVTQVGIEAWIEEQIVLPYTTYLTDYKDKLSEITTMIQAVHPGENVDRSRTYTDFVFWENAFKGNNVLRNKAAFALHQILVLSTRSIKLNGKGYGGSDYYDVLYEGAFGNYRDLMYDVSTHLMMGFYLSHLKNQKANITQGTVPDENYAREIMQLFSIGLYELNNDGSQKLDANGEPIPTYDLDDITELAKIFTGLSGGAYDIERFPSYIGEALQFNRPFNHFDATAPMIMWEDRHETSQKIMLDGTIIPAGQTGMQDINDAIDVLFNHPNVGPFLALRLIQQLVKSNPSPEYINRVASAFNNNGQGIRGDMRTVFRAILLDPEARDCDKLADQKTGKLRQPLERFITLCRAFDIDSPSGRLWKADYQDMHDEQEQTFMGASTVFNFFTPFYAEDEYVAPNDMVSPEFQILHSVTSIHYLNWMEDAINIRPFRNTTLVNPTAPKLRHNDADSPFLDLRDEIDILDNNGVSALIDRLDLILCYGSLYDGSKTIIEDALNQLVNTGNFTSEEIVKAALYFIVASADYAILK